ncbi:chain length determinant protein [Treponema sp. OMZ 305]|uniref:GNVR domain-containing protein n=1 Tax=Treponema sp. OMZ 305 TaxID=1659192 RepID=UPI0020A4CA23|nr:GNVR domain-containing protein [Treponema sp. OMZ 305]UTC58644.1 chain length determinant protein [Treponema sp. OMZ 305]
MEHDINNNSDEISLLDLVAVLWRWRWLIVALTGIVSIGVFTYVLIGKKMDPQKSYMPDVYTSTAFMRIQSSTSSSGGTLASMLQQNGLGNLAGGGSDNTQQLALYIAGSNSFLDTIADELHIAEKYKIKKFLKTETRTIVKGLLKAKMDEKSGVFSLAATHIEPEFAQKAVLIAVEYYEKRFAELGLDKKVHEKENLEKSLKQSFDEIKRLEREAGNLENKIAQSGGMRGTALTIEQIKREISIQEKIYGQLKAQYELLKVEMAGETPVFQILDMPEVPEKKSGPSRAKICIVAFAAGLFFSIFLAFLLNAVQEIYRDPEVQAKFLRKKDKPHEV